MPKVKCSKEERAEAIKTLRQMCRPGSTVYTILRHCSSSGMMRRISLVVIRKGETRQIDYLAATGEHLLGYAIVNPRGFYVAAEASPGGLVLWRGLADARLHDSRTAAYRAILKQWEYTYEVVRPKVVRVVRCTLCDQRGVGCDRCGGLGMEVRR